MMIRYCIGCFRNFGCHNGVPKECLFCSSRDDCQIRNKMEGCIDGDKTGGICSSCFCILQNHKKE